MLVVSLIIMSHRFCDRYWFPNDFQLAFGAEYLLVFIFSNIQIALVWSVCVLIWPLLLRNWCRNILDAWSHQRLEIGFGLRRDQLKVQVARATWYHRLDLHVRGGDSGKCQSTTNRIEVMNKQGLQAITDIMERKHWLCNIDTYFHMNYTVNWLFELKTLVFILVGLARRFWFCFCILPLSLHLVNISQTAGAQQTFRDWRSKQPYICVWSYQKRVGEYPLGVIPISCALTHVALTDAQIEQLNSASDSTSGRVSLFLSLMSEVVLMLSWQ